MLDRAQRRIVRQDSAPVMGSGSIPMRGRRVSRRSLIAGLLASSTAMGQQARGVTIAGFEGWFQDAFDQVVLAAFRKTHPLVPVSFYAAGNSFQILSLMRGQTALPYIDVVLLELGAAAQAMKAGLVEPLTPATMPVLKDLAPNALPQAAGGPVLMLDSLVMGYNPTRLPRAPHAWRDLWDPAFGSGIALTRSPDAIALAMTTVAAHLFGGADPVQSLDSGLTALSALRPRVVAWDPIPDVYTAVAVGDAAIAPGWNARAQYQSRQTQGRFAVAVPVDGSPTLPITVNLVKNTQVPDGAKTLIAWLLSPDAQVLLAQALSYAPVNARVVLPPDVQERAAATPANISRRIQMDWVNAIVARDKVTEEWRRHGLMGY